MTKILKAWAAEIAYLHHSSLENVECRYHWGTVSERHLRIYRLFWDWGACRVADPHRWPQDRLSARRGREALIRRMNQFRLALDEPLYAE